MKKQQKHFDFPYLMARLLGRFIRNKEKRRAIRGQLAAMSVTTVIDKGRERKPYFKELKGWSVDNLGKNNKIRITLPQFKSHFKVDFHGNNHLVEIGPYCVGDLNICIHAGDGSHIIIDEHCSFASVNLFVQDNPVVHIHAGCMFSFEIELRVTDGHTILNRTSRKIITQNDNHFIIGKHCWIGARATLLKNTQLPDNTIVGCGAIVTKKFTQEYTAIAGNPAKVIQTDVDWDYRTIKKYEQDMKIHSGNKR